MNRFSPKGGGIRIAAFVTHCYPDPGQVALYEQAERLAAGVGAEIRFLHSSFPNLSQLGLGLKRRVGEGFLVPWPAVPLAGRADEDHLRRVTPERFAEMLSTFARLLCTDEVSALDSEQFQAACAYARLAQAWAPDAVWVLRGDDGFPFGPVVARLLGVPMIYWARAADSWQAPVTRPVALGYSSLVVAASDTAVDDEVRTPANQMVVRLPEEAGESGLVVQLRAALVVSVGRDVLPLGPKASFITEASRRRCSTPGARPFLVLGAERTGSNLLVDMIAAQSRFACAGELFNPRAMRAGELAWLPLATYDEPALLRVRGRDPSLLHDLLWAAGRQLGADWVGYKLLYFHGAIDNRIVDDLAGLHDLRIVHLTRRDRLRRWLSHCKALAIDEWYARKGERREHAAITLDAEATAAVCAETELMEDRYRATFVDHPLLELDYDDFAGDLAGTRAKLGSFFGVDLGRLEPRSEKTGETDLAKAISNLEELRAAFADTRWEALFR